MKVLEKGREQQGWAVEEYCSGNGNGGGGCGARLLIEQPDLFKTHRHDYGGGSESFITFKCFDCGVLTDLDGVPRSVTGRIPNTQKEWENAQERF